MDNEPIDLASGRYLNESAIRSHALKCSQKYRAGRFTRVSEDFIDEVKADVEAFLRGLRLTHPTLHPPVSREGIHMDSLTLEYTFATGAFYDKLSPILNDAIARIVQNKVQRQPSCGKTLGRTR